MTDISSIGAAVTSLKTAIDITRTLVDIKSATDVQSKIIELQSQIMSAQTSALQAQSEQFDLKRRLGDAENELKRLKVWEGEKARYALVEIASGVFVYKIKEKDRGSEPSHWLCANCFNKGEKAFLQLETTWANNRGQDYKCHNCDSVIKIRNSEEERRRPGLI
jgi:hypothetical protein